MQFNSLEFARFLAVVLPCYFALGRLPTVRPQNVFLLAVSYWFYGAWESRFLALLLVSTAVDFIAGVQLGLSKDPRRRRSWLLLSLTVNLGILVAFKYYGFFVESTAAFLRAVGLQANPDVLAFVLPIGISFYTFQTIAYTYSVYKREIEPTRDPLVFALYVAYFPQLVAGPIERAQRLLPQLEHPRAVSATQFGSGSLLVIQGLFKKIVLADSVAPYVELAFKDPASASSSTLLLGMYLFALQIYGDFSGYTDIARGISRILGIELILNFRQPYLARNVTEFWRRWHISLSAWLRDHVYIPLGGSKCGTMRTHANLMATMLIGGLWHGAGWHFVVWGGLHGLFLVIHKILLALRAASGAARRPRSAVATVGGALLTFHLVCLAWIFFRAHDLATAWEFLQGIAAADFAAPAIPLPALLLLPLAFTLDAICVRHQRQTPVTPSSPPYLLGLVCGAAVVMIILAPASGRIPFIYFQF